MCKQEIHENLVLLQEEDVAVLLDKSCHLCGFSMKIWEKRHPERLKRLERAMQAVRKAARSLDIAPVFLISPRLLREYFWMEPAGGDFEKFLRSEGVNDWRLSVIVKVIEASNL